MEVWDHIPDEKCLKHPRILWKSLYEGVYVPYIALWGAHVRPTIPTSKRNEDIWQPPGAWYRARKAALRQLSILHTGFDPDTNGPVQMLKLVERPDHSNFSEAPTRGQDAARALAGKGATAAARPDQDATSSEAVAASLPNRRQLRARMPKRRERS
eukprot:scaffold15995_cov120-Isochrysis_galbana.AAC.2